MPCDSIQINKVQWNKVSREWLEKAAKELGWGIRIYGSVVTIQTPKGVMNIDINNGPVTSTMAVDKMNECLNKLKQGYSHVVVKEQARKLGWRLKQSAPNKFVAIRR